MTENKQFIIDIEETYQENAVWQYDEKLDDYDFVCFIDDSDTLLEVFDKIVNENVQLKSENKRLKEDLEHCANQFTESGKNILLGL